MNAMFITKIYIQYITFVFHDVIAMMMMMKGDEEWLFSNPFLLNRLYAFQQFLNVKQPITKCFFHRKYTLKKILSIHSTEDIRKGTRFFLNLKLQERATNSTKFVASYVYRKKGETTLCFPEHFRWNPHAMVHVVVPVKDSSAWVLALVQNIEGIESTLCYWSIEI